MTYIVLGNRTFKYSCITYRMLMGSIFSKFVFRNLCSCVCWSTYYASAVFLDSAQPWSSGRTEKIDGSPVSCKLYDCPAFACEMGCYISDTIIHTNYSTSHTIDFPSPFFKVILCLVKQLQQYFICPSCFLTAMLPLTSTRCPPHPNPETNHILFEVLQLGSMN